MPSTFSLDWILTSGRFWILVLFNVFGTFINWH
jgi:hypothetical protein